MNRLAKKCVIASAVLHGTLVLVLLVGPAFFTSDDPLDAKQIIDFIPYKTIEASVSGGGIPNVEQRIPAPQPEPPKPTPQQPTPPVREPETPVKREEPKQREREKPAVKSEEAGWKPSEKIKINLKQTTRGSTERTSAKTPNRNTERAQSFDTAINKIKSSASGSVKIDDFKGPGGGGIPYAGFNDALISAYMRAWLIPSEAADETSKVVVTITLRRDGTVLSSRIQTRSGNSALDASVQRALDKVTFVAPFPDSVKDAQKTFWLQFDPRARRMMG